MDDDTFFFALTMVLLAAVVQALFGPFGTAGALFGLCAAHWNHRRKR